MEKQYLQLGNKQVELFLHQFVMPVVKKSEDNMKCKMCGYDTIYVSFEDDDKIIRSCRNCQCSYPPEYKINKDYV